MRGVTDSVYGGVSSKRVVFRTLGNQAWSPSLILIPDFFRESDARKFIRKLQSRHAYNDITRSLSRDAQRGQCMQRNKGRSWRIYTRDGVNDRRMDASSRKMIYERRNERCFQFTSVSSTRGSGSLVIGLSGAPAA